MAGFSTLFGDLGAADNTLALKPLPDCSPEEMEQVVPGLPVAWVRAIEPWCCMLEGIRASPVLSWARALEPKLCIHEEGEGMGLGGHPKWGGIS